MRVRPLSMVAAGVVLVALDFRIVAVDVLPDVVGWSLVALGTWRLGLAPSAGLAAVAAFASAADLVAPHHYDALDPLTGEVVADPVPGLAYHERLAFDRLADVRFALAVLAMVAGGAALWSLLGALRYRARVTGDHESAGRLHLLRWLVPLLWVGPYAAVATVQLTRDGGLDPVWNGGLETVALTGIAVAASLAWLLAARSNRLWTATDAGRARAWTGGAATPPAP